MLEFACKVVSDQISKDTVHQSKVHRIASSAHTVGPKVTGQVPVWVLQYSRLSLGGVVRNNKVKGVAGGGVRRLRRN